MSNLCNIHVLHIVSGDLWAGAEVQLFTLARTLHNHMGARVSVAILNPGALEQRLRELGVEVIVLDESKLNGFQILRELIKSIRSLKPDVIHTHRSKENILGSIAARLCGNIPSLRTAHGAPEHHPHWYHIPKRIILFLDWFCGRYLQQRIIAVSDDLSYILNRDYPSPKVKVIKNGIDVASFTEAQKSSPTESAIGKNTYRIGIAGRLVPVKRVDLFIQTAHQILNNYPDFEASFHIFGDGPLRVEMENLSHQLGMSGDIYFEGHCNNFTPELQRLDALLMTSDHEGLPMVLLEAMLNRVPIIAHAVGGIPDLLDSGAAGILVHEHNAKAYSQEIYNLLNDIKACESIISSALERVKTIYSAEKNAQEYCSTYLHLINKATSPEHS